MARTVGLPTAWNRLLNFHMVRSTKAVVYTPANFVQSPCDSALRSAEHLLHNPGFPDPMYYLNFLGKYFFRNTRLRHLRIEQFNRYCMLVDATSAATANLTSENTVDDEDPVDGYRVVDANHRNYDRLLESVAAGTRFPATMQGVPGARRRHDARLGVSRMPLLEMCGAGRENYYQQRLLTSLAWWCPGPALPVTVNGKEALQWSFVWTPPLAGRARRRQTRARNDEDMHSAGDWVQLRGVLRQFGKNLCRSGSLCCLRLLRRLGSIERQMRVVPLCDRLASLSVERALAWRHVMASWESSRGSPRCPEMSLQFTSTAKRPYKAFEPTEFSPPNISLRFLELTPAAADHCA